MNQLAIHNPFDAPVYHEDTVDSTMNVSRVLARQGEPHGTVIVADFQEAGRGRVKGRSWDMERGSSLAFSILFRFSGIEHIPPALTLRTGLAVSLAIEDFAPALSGRVLIKWPNDILIAASLGTAASQAALAQKTAGILAEADGGNVHVGIGINVAQKQFPDSLQDKATSISRAAGREIAREERFALLEKILACLYAEVEGGNNAGCPAGHGWRSSIEKRLYQKGKQVCFIPGAADSKERVNGILVGIGPGGELLIGEVLPQEALPSKHTRAFTTGELLFSGISVIV